MKRFGLNLYSVRNLIKTEESFLNTALRLKEQGYSYLQYSGGEFDPARIARVSEASGLPVVLTHVPMARILEDTDALMQEHELFGCRNIGLGMMPLDILQDDEACLAAIGKLERAAKKMRENGFGFFYHHHHFEFRKMKDGRTVFDALLETAEHVNITADTYWLQYGGADVVSALEKLRGRLECVHLKDYKITGGAEKGYAPDFAPLSEGVLDFKKIVAKMKECGAKYFLVEQDNAADFPDPLLQTAVSAEYLKKEV